MGEQKPLFIKVNEKDNVVIVVNEGGLPAGTVFEDGFTLTTEVPQGHKAALTDIPKGGNIVRYGQIIGYAVRDIAKGSWIDESLVELPKAPDVDELVYEPRHEKPLAPLEG